MARRISRHGLESHGQLTLWENPAFVWDASVESEIRRIAPLKAYEMRFEKCEYGEFEAFCVERLYERTRNGGGIKSVRGVKRAMTRLALDWLRMKGRTKRQQHEDITEFEAVTVAYCVSDNRMMIDHLADSFPWLAVVGAALESGFKLSVIAEAFGMEVSGVESRLAKERERAASLL